LRRRLQNHKANLVHAHGLKTLAAMAFVGRPSVPTIWHFHDYLLARPVMSRFLRLQSSRCAAIVANSRSVAEDARIAMGSGPEIHVVYNAVDLKQFCPEGPVVDLDRMCGLPEAPVSTLKIGLVATTARWKGHAVFLRSLSQLHPSLPVR